MTDPAALNLFLDDLARALDGGGPVILPAPGSRASAHTLARSVTGFGDTPPPAMIVHTSGSTGHPKGVALSARALRASAEATLAALGGPGRWYLPLPLTHIAGAQVAVRSLLARERPFLASPGAFTAASFHQDVSRLRAAMLHGTSGPGRLYTSLVPTQLQRILADPAATEAAAGFDALLIGGSSLPAAIRDRAHDAGLPIVRTYGMSETAGGCVYDGLPLPGVRIDLAEGATDQDEGTGRQGAVSDDDTTGEACSAPAGRITLTGPMVASGYVAVENREVRLLPDPSPFAAGLPPSAAHLGDAGPGEASFRTSDLGRLEGGVLSVLGRSDDVLISGGVNVHPLRVEAAALDAVPELPGILITGVPDDEWGTRIVALVPGPVDDGLLGRLRDALRPLLDAAELPTAVMSVPELPQTGIGKPDRRAAARLARSR